MTCFHHDTRLREMPRGQAVDDHSMKHLRARFVQEHRDRIQQMLSGQRRRNRGDAARGVLLFKDGFVRPFTTIHDAAEFLGVHPGRLYPCIRGGKVVDGWRAVFSDKWKAA